MYRRGTLLLAVALVIPASVLLGQSTSTAPEKHATALRLLAAMNTERTLNASAREMLDLQMRLNPDLAPFKQIMADFMEKHSGWTALKDEFATIYANEFTQRELEEMLSFFTSPVGKRFAAQSPSLTRQTMKLAETRIAENTPELEEAIKAAIIRERREHAPSDPD